MCGKPSGKINSLRLNKKGTGGHPLPRWVGNTQVTFARMGEQNGSGGLKRRSLLRQLSPRGRERASLCQGRSQPYAERPEDAHRLRAEPSPRCPVRSPLPGAPGHRDKKRGLPLSPGLSGRGGFPGKAIRAAVTATELRGDTQDRGARRGAGGLRAGAAPRMGPSDHRRQPAMPQNPGHGSSLSPETSRAPRRGCAKFLPGDRRGSALP